MSQPLVSIIMPVYNVERYVKEAIDSALNQTYPHLELIIMNDGSSDGSAGICRSYTDPRVRYYENPANMGVLRTRNEALKLAQGEYVAWLDSDDISLPTRLEKQVSFLEANPVLIDVSIARDVMPAMASGRKLILHAGPPIAWPAMCGPMRGGILGAIVLEGWADTIDAATRLLESGSVALEPCHHHAAVGPMAGIISPSMPVWVVENATGVKM